MTKKLEFTAGQKSIKFNNYQDMMTESFQSNSHPKCFSVVHMIIL